MYVGSSVFSWGLDYVLYGDQGGAKVAQRSTITIRFELLSRLNKLVLVDRLTRSVENNKPREGPKRSYDMGRRGLLGPNGLAG